MEVSDPIIASLAILLTFLLRMAAVRLHGEGKTLLHYYSPALATLIAVGLQAAWLALSAESVVTFPALGRGLLAGCLAVAGHSQYRELLAHLASRTPPAPAPPTEDDSP